MLNWFYGWDVWRINNKMLPMETENYGFGGKG